MPDSTCPGRFDVIKLAGDLDEVHQRLAGVIIERLPWAEFLARYDSPEVLYYVDPPYWGTEHVYGPGLFARADFARLADALAGLKGRFILSLNDVPEVREVFGRFDMAAEAHTWGIAQGQTAARELVISGPVRGV